MAKKLEDLTFDLVADNKRLLAGVAGAQRATSASVTKMRRSFNTLKSLMKPTAVAIGGVTAATAGIGVAVQRTISELDDLAKAIGSTSFDPKSFQEIAFALRRSGASGDEATKALRRLDKAVSDVRNGSGELTTILRRTNPELLEQVKSAGSSEEALRLLVGELERTAKTSDATALALAIGGSSGSQALLNLSKDGVEGLDSLIDRAQEVGIALSEDTLQGAEAAQDELDILTEIIKTRLLSTLGLLAPQIEDVAGSINDFLSDPEVQERIKRFGELLSDIVESLLNTDDVSFDGLRRELATLIEDSRVLATLIATIAGGVVSGGNPFVAAGFGIATNAALEGARRTLLTDAQEDADRLEKINEDLRKLQAGAEAARRFGAPDTSAATRKAFEEEIRAIEERAKAREEELKLIEKEKRLREQRRAQDNLDNSGGAGGGGTGGAGGVPAAATETAFDNAQRLEDALLTARGLSRDLLEIEQRRFRLQEQIGTRIEAAVEAGDQEEEQRLRILQLTINEQAEQDRLAAIQLDRLRSADDAQSELEGKTEDNRNTSRDITDELAEQEKKIKRIAGLARDLFNKALKDLSEEELVDVAKEITKIPLTDENFADEVGRRAQLAQEMKDRRALAERRRQSPFLTGASEFGEAFADRIENLQPTIMELGTFTADTLVNGATRFGDTLVDAFARGDSAADALKASVEALGRQIARQVIGQLITSSIGSAVSGLEGLFAGPRAEGGPIPPGKFSLVGEKGPEIALGGAQGKTIVPLVPGGRGGGTSVVVQNVNQFDRASVESRQERQPDGTVMIRNIVREIFNNDMRSNGPMARTLQSTTNNRRKAG